MNILKRRSKLSKNSILYGSSTKKPLFTNQQRAQNQLTKQTIQKIIKLKPPEHFQNNQIANNFKTDDNFTYLSKNSLESLLLRIDRTNIQLLDSFSKQKIQGFNLLEFVRFFLNILQHQQIQNLYITIGLIDLYKAISIFSGQQILSFSNITNYLCEKIIEKKQKKYKIQRKNIPQIKYVKPNYQIKDFIRNPPIIYGQNDDILYKLSHNSIYTDKNKHKRAVHESQLSSQLKNVFILDSLSEYIAVYDYDCQLTRKISPSFLKYKKDTVILSFAFSQRQLRLGAVLKNFTLIFWDSQNNFQYQKSFLTTSSTQNLQTTIKYLDYFDTWLTTDKQGNICFWDLLHLIPKKQIRCKYESAVNNICEISSLNLLAVVQQNKQLSMQKQLQQQFQQNFNQNGTYIMNNSNGLKRANSMNNSLNITKKNSFLEFNITLYNFFTGQIVTQIFGNEDRVPHTLCYSQDYQILFSGGLQRKIKLFQINPIHMDTNLKGQLIGHQNLITCFSLLNKTSLLISCDDKGMVKLWDFKNYSCLQTIDFSDKALITNLLDMIQIGKIGILGSRVHYIDFQDKLQIIKKYKNKDKLSIQWVEYDQSRDQFYIFTHKDLRVLDLKKGSIKYIYGSFNNNNDCDYTCFRYFPSLSKFTIGTDKGQISVYDIDTGSWLYQLKGKHQGSVISIQYDQLNKNFISIGRDSSIFVHKQSTKQLIRIMKGNFYGKQISCFQISVYHNLIALSTNYQEYNRSIFLWNYQFGKLVGEVVIKQGDQVVSLQFLNSYSILAIATQKGTINFVKIYHLGGCQIKIQQLISIQLQQINKINIDLILKGSEKNTQLQQCIISTFYKDSTFQNIDITQYLKQFQTIPHCKQKTNYNPHRQNKQCFMNQITRKKFYKLQLIIQTQEKTVKYITQVQVLNQNNENNIINNQLDKTSLIIKSELISSNFSCVNLIKLMNLDMRYTVIVGANRRIKIYSDSHKLICDLNINYPLPYLWQFKPELHKKVQDKIYFAVKVMNMIMKRYQFDISITQSKNFRFKELFDLINGNKKQKNQQQTNYNNLTNVNQSKIKRKNSQKYSNLITYQNNLMLTQVNYNNNTYNQKSKDSQFKKRFYTQIQNQNQINKIPLIQQQYTKNDLNYDLIKKYNFHEIAGPTLKQLDHIKKIDNIQKQWKIKQQQQQIDRQKLLKSIQLRTRKTEQKDQLAIFLSPKIKIKQSKQNIYVMNIRKKIQNYRSQQQQTRISSINTGNKYVFNTNVSTFKKQIKKQIKQEKQKQKQKQLFARCLLKHKTLNNFNNSRNNNFNSTFEQYYTAKQRNSVDIENKKTKQKTQYQSENSKQNKNSIILRASTSENNLRKFNRTKFKFQQDSFLKFSSNIGFDLKKIKRSDSQLNLQDNKPNKKGYKFRQILTQMNDRVREKKISKIKIQ